MAERASADDGSAVLALPRPHADAHEALPGALRRRITETTARIIVVEIVVAEDNNRAAE